VTGLVDEHYSIATIMCSDSIRDGSLLEFPPRSLGAGVDTVTTATYIAHLVVGAIGEQLGASAHRAPLRIAAGSMVIAWKAIVGITRRVHIFVRRADSGPGPRDCSSPSGVCVGD
jgi:hypothetical protein